MMQLMKSLTHTLAESDSITCVRLFNRCAPKSFFEEAPAELIKEFKEPIKMFMVERKGEERPLFFIADNHVPRGTKVTCVDNPIVGLVSMSLLLRGMKECAEKIDNGIDSDDGELPDPAEYVRKGYRQEMSRQIDAAVAMSKFLSRTVRCCVNAAGLNEDQIEGADMVAENEYKGGLVNVVGFGMNTDDKKAYYMIAKKGPVARE